MPHQDNLARQSYVSVPVEQPKVHTSPQPTQPPVNKEQPATRKLPWTRLEKTVLSVFSLAIFGLASLNIAAGVEVNALNQSFQDTRNDIEQAQLVNSNLEQQSQELSRYDRIYAIAEKFGLQVNEENVRNVGE